MRCVLILFIIHLITLSVGKIVYSEIISEQRLRNDVEVNSRDLILGTVKSFTWNR